MMWTYEELWVPKLERLGYVDRFRKEKGLPNIHNVYVDNAINVNESHHSSKYMSES